jgi:hypothetical protein
MGVIQKLFEVHSGKDQVLDLGTIVRLQMHQVLVFPVLVIKVVNTFLKIGPGVPAASRKHPGIAMAAAAVAVAVETLAIVMPIVADGTAVGQVGGALLLLLLLLLSPWVATALLVVAVAVMLALDLAVAVAVEEEVAVAVQVLIFTALLLLLTGRGTGATVATTLGIAEGLGAAPAQG